MKTTRELLALYQQGENISQYVRQERGIQENTREIIELSYDLQAGSYVSAMSDPVMAAHKEEYSEEIARIIKKLKKPGSIMEAGVGECTTFSGVLKNLDNSPSSFGFDLSWSRVAHAQRWLSSNGISSTRLCTGDLFNIPFRSDSVEIVYTSHSIEPNGGNERPIIQELFRVCRNYLILLEPGYELASDEAKERMTFHGYCKNIPSICEELGYDVLDHRLFPYVSNPLNPTAITIVSKGAGGGASDDILACPLYKTPLKRINNVYFSPEALVAYPIIGGIPCLRKENGILASKFEEIFRREPLAVDDISDQ